MTMHSRRSSCNNTILYSAEVGIRSSRNKKVMVPTFLVVAYYLLTTNLASAFVVKSNTQPQETTTFVSPINQRTRITTTATVTIQRHGIIIIHPSCCYRRNFQQYRESKLFLLSKQQQQERRRSSSSRLFLASIATTPTSTNLDLQSSNDTSSSSKITRRSFMDGGGDVITSGNNVVAIVDNQEWTRWEQQLIQLGRQGRSDEALALFDNLMYSVITLAQQQQQQQQQQQRTITRQQQQVVLPPLSKRVRWWNAALDACARARPTRIDDALALFQRGLQMQWSFDNKQKDDRDSDDHHHHPVLQPNVFTFGILISACARARRADLALDFLRSMETIYGVSPNAVVFSTVISACAKANPHPMVSTALDLLHEATHERRLPMNVVGYNAVLAACANAGDWQQAMTILDQMEHQQLQDQNVDTSNHNNTNRASSFSLLSSSATTRHPSIPLPPIPDMVTYGTVMAACERGEQWELVLECAKRASKQVRCMDVLALTSALHACQQLGLAQEALQFLQLMKNLQQQQQGRHQERDANEDSQEGHEDKKTFGWQRKGVKKPLRGPDAVAYRLAISACARGGAWQEGLTLLEELRMLDTTTTADTSGGCGVGADVVAYTAAINGCEYAGEWQHAFVLLDQMRKDGIQPNEVTMASVLGACATACAKLVATTSSSPTNNSGSNSNNEHMKQQHSTSTSSSSSNSHHQQQQRQAFLSFRGDDTTMYLQQQPRTTMLTPQKKALQLLQLMKKDEATLVRPNIVVYNAAIRVCAESCDLFRAMALWEDLRRAGLEATVVTYGSLMTACERVGNLDAASKVFNSMNEDGLAPNEIIYGAAISCCRKARQPERAVLLLRKMIREGLSPNVATFHTVLVAQTDAMYYYTKDSGGDGGKNGIHNINLHKADMERAVLVYKLMKSHKYSSPESRPNRQTYHLLIRALALRRYPHEAEFLLHKMQQDGMIPDVDLYTATVTAYERIGQPLQALRLMESMREDGYDFYEVKVLNEAFKKAINLVHVVAGGSSKGLSNNSKNEKFSSGNNDGSSVGGGLRFGLNDDDEDDDELEKLGSIVEP